VSSRTLAVDALRALIRDALIAHDTAQGNA
jgi:hypothetical protein